jgi:membrane protein required for colicin V production
MGLAVGFLKGGLWLACWVGALFATIYAYPYFEPSLWTWLSSKEVITNKFLGDLAVGAGIFLISLVFLFILSSVVTGWVRTSRINALDRSLGFLAGAVAAVFIVGAAYIPFASAWATPGEQPSWLREAKLRPAIEWASGVVASVLPAELTERLPKGESDAGASGQTYEDLAKPPQPEAKTGADGGYTDQQRGDMERLMNSTGGR